MSVLFSLATIMVFFLSSWFSSANALTFLTEQEAAKTLGIQYKTENGERLLASSLLWLCATGCLALCGSAEGCVVEQPAK